MENPRSGRESPVLQISAFSSTTQGKIGTHVDRSRAFRPRLVDSRLLGHEITRSDRLVSRDHFASESGDENRSTCVIAPTFFCSQAENRVFPKTSTRGGGSRSFGGRSVNFVPTSLAPTATLTRVKNDVGISVHPSHAVPEGFRAGLV